MLAWRLFWILRVGVSYSGIALKFSVFTSQAPTDLDNIREGHPRGEVETYCL
jgi:hypothetical protein